MIEGNFRSQTIPNKSRKLNFIECPLCYELVEQYRMACICFCDHEFCELCLVEYIQQKLKNFETIVCPAEGCEGKLDTDCGLMVSLTESEKKKYRQIKFRKFAEQNNWMLCPNEHCEEGTLKKHSTKRKGKCGKCKTIYCLKCMLPKHKGPCQNMEEMLLKQKYDFKKCPNCQRLVERNQGCRHMTCKCQSQFCYDCGGAWSGNHVCVVKEKINLQNFKQSQKQSEFEKQSEQQKQSEHEEQQINFPQPTYITQKIDIFLRKTCCFFFINKNYRRLSKCAKIKWVFLTFIYYIVFCFLLLLWFLFYTVFTILYLSGLVLLAFSIDIYFFYQRYYRSEVQKKWLIFFTVLSIIFFPITWILLGGYIFCLHLNQKYEILLDFFKKGINQNRQEIQPQRQEDIGFSLPEGQIQNQKERYHEFERQKERKCIQMEKNEKIRDRQSQKRRTQNKIKEQRQKKEKEKKEKEKKEKEKKEKEIEQKRKRESRKMIKEEQEKTKKRRNIFLLRKDRKLKKNSESLQSTMRMEEEK